MKYNSFKDSIDTSFIDLQKFLFNTFDVEIYANGYMMYDMFIIDSEFKYTASFCTDPNNLIGYEFTYIVDIVIALLTFKELFTDNNEYSQIIDISKLNKKVTKLPILFNKMLPYYTIETITISKNYKESQFIRNNRHYKEIVMSVLNDEEYFSNGYYF